MSDTFEELKALIDIEDPDEVAKEIQARESEIEEEERVLDLIHKQIQNKHKENAIFFESLKQKLIEARKQDLDNTAPSELTGELADLTKGISMAHLVSVMLRDDPSYDDMSKRLEKIKGFISQATDEGDDIFELAEDDEYE